MQRHASQHPLTQCLLALGLVLLASAAVAQTKTTYRWVDAQGVVHYSDTPQPGAQVIQLPSAQTYRAQSPTPAAIKAANANAAAVEANDPNSPYQSCGIADPSAEASFFAPETIPISVALSPGLRPGDQLQVLVDGAAVNPISPGGLQYQIPGPERGTHSVSAMVRDADGKAICHSPPVTFYVQRPSTFSPQSPVRPH